MNKKGAYAKVGVDVDVEAEASRIMYEASKKTFKNRKGLLGEIISPFDDFAALKMVAVGNLPKDSYFSMGFDTGGTKVELAQRMGIHNTIAFDVFAMVCDDAVLRGGEPVLVGTNLDIKSLGMDDRYLPIMRELAEGYVAAADAANVSIVNGEIIQMGSLVSGHGEFPYHWGAACLWFARKSNLFTGTEIKAGDSIVALKENGFRCNGWSLVRSVFKEKYGEQWHNVRFKESTIGLQALTPSIIYSRLIVSLHGGFDSKGSTEIHGIVHVTGGGLPEKVARVLRPSKLGAELDNLFSPPEIMQHCQNVGSISDVDAYGAWNMGQGMLVITPTPDLVITEAAKFGIEARLAGKIVNSPEVRITSRGVEAESSVLTYPVK